MLDSGHATLADLHQAWKDVRKRIAEAGTRYAKSKDVPQPAAPPIIPAPPLPEIEPYCPPLSIKVLITTGPTKLPTIALIQQAVSDFYGFSRVEICSERRTDALCRARHVGFLIARRLTLNSFPVIGLKFGRKDHTTVMHGVARIERRMASDEGLVEEVNQIQMNVLARCS